ncbi:cation-translocating P-type ATPase [Candidatus Thorarchaeota archaeon]|nr:MAG: cation-translocating P-type ATPase [Candidatus Thorarchaeota archaeon]
MMAITWHSLDTKSALKNLDSSDNGLTQSEAERRIEEYGPNEITITQKSSAIRLFVSQFKNILTIILILAAVVSLVVQEAIEAILILAIVFASALLGFVQEYRAERALETLRNMLNPSAVVIRDGKTVMIPSRDIVPGDVIVLKEGDRLPADGRVIQSTNLKVSEAIITGESVPVQKSSEVLPRSTPLGDMRNMVLSGTEVTYGKGIALVVNTGLNTEFGKIASQVAMVKKEVTPLEKRTKEIGFWLGTISLSVCALVVIVGLLREFFISGSITTQFAVGLLLFGIALAVAAVPEALPGVVTGSLAIGMQRMARQNALVRRMAAVETLGCTSVICADKTGTITRGEMTVREVFLTDGTIKVEGEGYEPTGSFIPIDSEQSILEKNHFSLLTEGCVLCNDALLEESDGRWKILGDPTEGALIVLARKAGVDDENLRSEHPRIGEIPFSSDRKRMSTVHSSENDSKLIYTKGACEFILEQCTAILSGNGTMPLTDATRTLILEKNSEMASRALRVLALAYKQANELDVNSEDDVESDLTFLGLVGMIDPSRKDAIDAIAICKSVGILPIMITGDHKLTAKAIAEEVGIRQPDDIILTDSELDEISEEEYLNIVDKVTVYARVSPASKLKIVQTWKKRGEVVAMTGDGVNDAPALKQADIGIAMGITGTEVTKEASDLVLADDNFATIEKAIELGRWIYDNIKKYLAYLLRANLIEIIVLSFAVIIGYPLPLLPAQILYINLVTDGLPAIALGLSPPDADIMERPPRDPKESIFSKDVKMFYIITIIVQVPLFLFVFMSIAPLGVVEGDPALTQARSILFYLFVYCELALALTCRSLKYTIWEARPHKLLSYSIIGSAVLTAVLFGLVPGFAAAFKVEPFGLIAIEIVLALSIISLIAIEGLKILTQRKNNNVVNRLNRKPVGD